MFSIVRAAARWRGAVRWWSLIAALGTGVEVRAERFAYLIAEGAAEPYQIVREGADSDGLITDIVTEALADGAWQQQVLPYRRLQRAIERQQYRGWLWYAAPAWMTESHRRRGALIRVALFKANYQLVGLTRGPSDPVADSHGQRILVIDGYHYGGDFQQWLQAKGHSLVKAPSHAHALAMLRQGRGDYYLAEDLRIRWEIKRAGQGAADLRRHGFAEVIPDAVVYLMVDKRLPMRAREQLTDRLRELRDSGRLTRIRARYGASAP